MNIFIFSWCHPGWGTGAVCGKSKRQRFIYFRFPTYFFAQYFLFLCSEFPTSLLSISYFLASSPSAFAFSSVLVLHLVTGPLLVSAGHWSGSGEPDLGEPVVDRVPVVVQGGCLLIIIVIVIMNLSNGHIFQMTSSQHFCSIWVEFHV